MDSNSIFCVLLGLIIIVSRGPMVLAPTPAIQFYRRLIATDLRVRVSGLVLGSLAVALVTMTAHGQAATFWLRLLGWFWAMVAVWLLALPASYRLFVQAAFDFLQDSTDPAIVRGFAVFAVVFGVWLVHVGIAPF